ncbi:MAG: hypothetical protein QM764_10480 [Chitinophagaceae bacterium]
MKKQLILLAFSFVLFSCHKDDNNNNNADISQGTWRVTLFTDSGNDETSDFTGYEFTFANSGVLSAIRGAITTNGTWSRGSKFNIDLGVKSDSNKPLGELTDDWKILSISSNEIKLGDDNASSGESLTFTKN